MDETKMKLWIGRVWAKRPNELFKKFASYCPKNTVITTSKLYLDLTLNDYYIPKLKKLLSGRLFSLQDDLENALESYFAELLK